MSFFEKLTKRAQQVDSLLCVGLDPHRSELEEDSAEAAFRFCQRLIEETKDLAAAFKPNCAFFEVYGAKGWEALERTLRLIPEEIPIVLDAKRGDIGSTSEAYAQSAFHTLRCDSVTASPYLGGDGLQPFLKDASKGVWVLCKTSNPGSQDLQALQLPGGEPLYLHVAQLCEQWAKEHKNAGLVVGATDVEAMRKIRAKAPDVWFLSPGIGAQGGDLAAALGAGLRSDGLGMLLPISRGISKAESPRKAAEAFRAEMNACRASGCIVVDFQKGLEEIPDEPLRTALQDWAQRMNGHMQELRDIVSRGAEAPEAGFHGRQPGP
ncbi:unnamed protein product [Effrenium voratum]|nr:unnamed protein product [Effrenium voratum]